MQVRAQSASADARVVEVSGEVDLAQAAKLRAALIRAGDGVRLLVVDLSGVGFIDSTGLGVLVGRLRAMRTIGADLRLVVTSERIRHNFSITGLDRIFTLYDDAETALRPPEPA